MKVPIEEIISLKEPIKQSFNGEDTNILIDSGYIYDSDSEKRVGRIHDLDFAKFLLDKVDMFEEFKRDCFDVEEDGNRFLTYLNQFNNQIVVDLGSGSSPEGYELANRFGAKAYIAVEPVFNERLDWRLSDVRGINPDLTVPYTIVKTHMKDFLEHLPSDSVSLFVSGIDFTIINDGRYICAVDEQVTRVMHPDGILLSNSSVIGAKDMLAINPIQSKFGFSLNDVLFYSKKEVKCVPEVSQTPKSFYTRAASLLSCYIQRMK